MKIIDSKGRLFGKLNVIDLLTAIILLVVVGAVAMRLFGNKAIQSVTQPDIKIRYEVICEDIPEPISLSCEDFVGQQILSSGKLLPAYITDCKAAKDTDGKQVLYIVVEGTAKQNGYVYALGTQELRIGMEHLVKTTNVEFDGTICALEIQND